MIPEAKCIEQIRASTKGDDFTSSSVFTVEGKPGLWRQISRDGRHGIKTPIAGAVVAHVGEDRLIELIRWCEAENTLSLLAGLDVIAITADGEPAT